MSLSSLSSLSDEDIHPRRRWRDEERLHAFEIYDDVEFRMRFRLTKETVLHLVELIGDKIKPATKRSRAIEPLDQILIALRFFSTGTYQRVIGDIFHIEQPTVHRIVYRVAVELAKLRPQYINMPNPQEQLQVANDFYAIAGFPRVTGAVDCSHVKITSPGGAQAETFRNRKGFFSLNVHMVCDAKLIIRNVIARWPGSVHVSTIFNDSPLCAQMERGDFGNMFLLGDSGYPCRSYLLTPILNPTTAAQEAYNQVQISTRNPVERLFGVLKRRFPCLHFGLGLKVQNVPPIIVACAVLHNIAIMCNDNIMDFKEEPFIEDIEEAIGQHVLQNQFPNENFSVRTSIINTHFSDLI